MSPDSGRSVREAEPLEGLLDELVALGYRAVAICRKNDFGWPDSCWAESHRLLPGGGFSDDIRGEGSTRLAAVADLLSRVRDAVHG